jgi:hypothetical protein
LVLIFFWPFSTGLEFEILGPKIQLKIAGFRFLIVIYKTFQALGKFDEKTYPVVALFVQ